MYNPNGNIMQGWGMCVVWWIWKWNDLPIVWSHILYCCLLVDTLEMNRVWIHVEVSLVRSLYHLGNEQSVTRGFYSVMLDCLLIGRSIAGLVPRQLPPLAHYYLRYDKHWLFWSHMCNQEWYKCCLGNKVQQWVAGTICWPCLAYR